MKLLITGGAGFIGSAVIRHFLKSTVHDVINVDCLTYAASLDGLAEFASDARYQFTRVDVRDGGALREVFVEYEPDGVLHLAAESHVDRSIDGPDDFIQTNIVGTFRLLEESLRYFRALPAERQAAFRFHHISTDEVYGSLGDTGFFTESTPYAPNSPYSASKAASDHLVRAWHHTYKLPVVVTNCSNNYGPYQFPEKLIPVMILNALAGKPLPIYGSGSNVRDWLYVDDHARALLTVFERGVIGAQYNIGGHNEKRNIDLVNAICALLDELRPDSAGSYARLITFVEDRKGHDQRYAIDASKIERELGWRPSETFESGIRKTVEWYLDNLAWCQSLQQKYGGERLGLKAARS